MMLQHLATAEALRQWRGHVGDICLNPIGASGLATSPGRFSSQRALSAGVFGSPFYLFEGEVFWGQDRLDMLEEAIVRSSTADLGRRPAPLLG
jgi:hypothetical protein